MFNVFFSLPPSISPPPSLPPVLQYHKSSLQPVDVAVEGQLQDTDVADFSIEWLRNHSQNSQQPFFLTVGFRKPHLPFRYPKEYKGKVSVCRSPLPLSQRIRR